MCDEYLLGSEYYYVTNDFPSMPNDAVELQFNGFVMKTTGEKWGQSFELVFDLVLIECPSKFLINVPGLERACYY